MKPRSEALLRLFAVQASYTYERMLGIGVGHASMPLLRTVLAERTARARHEAVARSADFFNAHPYLAGVAVGAEVRAEEEGASSAMISRLRTALSGPLGSLGDQLIWAGWVPALIGVALAASTWTGIWGVAAIVVIHNILRFKVTAWGLDLGLREGLGVGAALQRSWLARGARNAQRLAALAVGLAIPVVTWRILPGAPGVAVAITLLVALAGTLLEVWPATRARVTGLRFGLLLVTVAVVIVGVTQ